MFFKDSSKSSECLDGEEEKEEFSPDFVWKGFNFNRNESNMRNSASDSISFGDDDQ